MVSLFNFFFYITEVKYPLLSSILSIFHRCLEVEHTNGSLTSLIFIHNWFTLYYEKRTINLEQRKLDCKWISIFRSQFGHANRGVLDNKPLSNINFRHGN